MSTKFKPFLQLSASQKRRRLSIIQGHSRYSESVAHDLNSSNSTSSDASENEAVEDPDPSVFDNDIHNDERCIVYNEDPSVSGKRIEDREGTSAENDENEEEGRDADNVEVQDNLIAEYNTSSNSSEDENDNNLQNLDELKKRALANAFLTGNLNHKQGNILLKTMRNFPFNLRYLPNDIRTLLQTPTNATRQIKKISGGEYFHLGVKCTLKKN